MSKARRLTDKGIERVRPGAERVEIPDAAVPGLRLIVQPSGRKSWAVRTRVHGKTAKITVGPWPAYQLKEAREKAGDILKSASRGEDPRRLMEAEQANTVEAVVADWLKKDQAGNRSRDETRRLFEREVLPRWRGRPITTITRRDCIEIIDKMAERAPTYARRLHAHLHRLFRWLVGRAVIEASPMADLPKPGAERPRDRVLTDAELVEVWNAAEKLGWPFQHIIRLLVLTGARRAEIGELLWPEVDEDVIRLSADRTKTGEPRLVPLSGPAKEIMVELREKHTVTPVKGAPPHVFTVTARTPVSGWSRAKTLIDKNILNAREEALGKDAQPMPEWRLHDLRRTVATGLQRLGFRLEVIEAVLGHISGSRAGVVGVYQRHAFEDEKRRALDAWASYVNRLTEGEDKGSQNVVALHDAT